MGKEHANQGVERNKKKLRNLIYEVELSQLRPDLPDELRAQYEKYKFKDLGYLVLYYKLHGIDIRNFHGFITPADLKELLGVTQWSKFCQGKRLFIIQRREDGKNISKK